MSTTKQVNCPNCKKPVPWVEAEKYRPFCSRKCQLLDFGDWAAEKHRIPAEEPGIFSEDDQEPPLQ